MSLVKVYSGLTTVQSASAVVFSTFVAIHGAQVAVSTIGGPDMSNRWLLLGRPLYQDQHLEGLLVSGAAVVHVLAGVAKAGIRRYWGQNNNNTTQSTRLLPYHHIVGYVLVPVVWLHYDLVRTLPVRYFGDSAMLDFGHIAWGLQNWPVFTYTLHGTLIGTAAYHIVSGASLAYQRTFKRKRSDKSSSSVYRPHKKMAAAATIGLVLLSGLFIIGRQTKKIPLRFEYEAIYKMLLPI